MWKMIPNDNMKSMNEPFNYMMTVFDQETEDLTEDQKTEKFMDRDFMKMCGEKAKAWDLRDLGGE